MSARPKLDAQLVDALLTRKEWGDHESMRYLYALIAHTLRNGGPLPDNARELIADAFDEIALGKDPKQALRLGRGRRGRSSFDNQHRDMRICEAVYHQLDAGAGRHTETKGAYALVAEEFQLSPDAVSAVYETKGEAFDMVLELSGRK